MSCVLVSQDPSIYTKLDCDFNGAKDWISCLDYGSSPVTDLPVTMGKWPHPTSPSFPFFKWWGRTKQYTDHTDAECLNKKGINLCRNTWFLVSWVGSSKTNTLRSFTVLLCPRPCALQFSAFQISQNWVSSRLSNFFWYFFPMHGLLLFCKYLLYSFPCYVYASVCTILCLLPLLMKIPLHPLITNVFFSMSFLTSPCLSLPKNLIWCASL